VKPETDIALKVCLDCPPLRPQLAGRGQGPGGKTCDRNQKKKRIMKGILVKEEQPPYHASVLIVPGEPRHTRIEVRDGGQLKGKHKQLKRERLNHNTKKKKE